MKRRKEEKKEKKKKSRKWECERVKGGGVPVDLPNRAWQ